MMFILARIWQKSLYLPPPSFNRVRMNVFIIWTYKIEFMINCVMLKANSGKHVVRTPTVSKDFCFWFHKLLN